MFFFFHNENFHVIQRGPRQGFQVDGNKIYSCGVEIPVDHDVKDGHVTFLPGYFYFECVGGREGKW